MKDVSLNMDTDQAKETELIAKILFKKGLNNRFRNKRPEFAEFTLKYNAIILRIIWVIFI